MQDYSSPRPSPWLLGLTVFAGGFAVMALEMCGFRVTTTEYGSSVYTTGSLLTLIMAALSGGYFVGGRISRRTRSLRPLVFMWLGAAAYTFVTGVLLAPTLLDWGFRLRERLELHPFAMGIVPPAFAVTVLYAIPMLLLATTTPLAVQASGNDSVAGTTSNIANAPGRTAGQLMSLSTVGSILGTLLTSYLFIPQFGTRRTLLLFCASLGVVGGLLLWQDRQRARSKLAALLTWALCLGAPFAPLTEEPKEALILATETNYNRVEVSRYVDREGDSLLLYKPSRSFLHSSVYPSRPLKDQEGLAYLTPAMARGAKRVLVLGVAGGGAVLQFHALDPEMDITGVDLDPAVLALSQSVFGVPQSPRIHLKAVDARVFLRESKEKYDYVVLDIFAGEALPPHCVTREFFALVRSHLNAAGSMFINTNMTDFPWSSSEAEEAIRPLRHMQAAIRAAGFPTIFLNDLFTDGYLYAFPFAEAIEDFRAGLLKMGREERWPTELRAAAIAHALKTVAAPTDHAAVEPFTDDWSPEDVLALKGNLVALTRREATRSKPADPGGDLSGLKALIAQELVRFLEEEGHWGLSPERYCGSLLDWTARTREPLLAALSLLHVPYIDCSARASNAALDERIQLAADYTHALSLTISNRGPEALPLLLSVAERSFND